MASRWASPTSSATATEAVIAIAVAITIRIPFSLFFDPSSNARAG
jgi:hypothetical protein